MQLKGGEELVQRLLTQGLGLALVFRLALHRWSLDLIRACIGLSYRIDLDSVIRIELEYPEVTVLMCA